MENYSGNEILVILPGHRQQVLCPTPRQDQTRGAGREAFGKSFLFEKFAYKNIRKYSRYANCITYARQLVKVPIGILKRPRTVFGALNNQVG